MNNLNHVIIPYLHSLPCVLPSPFVSVLLHRRRNVPGQQARVSERAAPLGMYTGSSSAAHVAHSKSCTRYDVTDARSGRLIDTRSSQTAVKVTAVIITTKAYEQVSSRRVNKWSPPPMDICSLKDMRLHNQFVADFLEGNSIYRKGEIGLMGHVATRNLLLKSKHLSIGDREDFQLGLKTLGRMPGAWELSS
ncbi:hypothetical protein EVAR_12686_1 [Eumeta japonica]|uniref:Uncharacterized protein n=1 Tax=Eumeta variegata TaxID=151549 RepID=A0A4C1UNV1_EUMVA|nr:hypothetical protein EVAR_12686_1 [Eumeta japonica]